MIHTFPDQQDKVYTPLLGDQSLLTGASLQNSWSAAHQRTLKWVGESAQAGRPWVVANDEQNPASTGRAARSGLSRDTTASPSKAARSYTLHDIRKLCLWGNLMAGGAGVEYYFGYKLPQNDLVCEDFRSRDQSWDYCRIALEFFREHQIPFWEMTNADELVGNDSHSNSRFCLAKPGESYLVYLPGGGTSDLDLGHTTGDFRVQWFNPRSGGALADGSVTKVTAGEKLSLGLPPQDSEGGLAGRDPSPRSLNKRSSAVGQVCRFYTSSLPAFFLAAKQRHVTAWGLQPQESEANQDSRGATAGGGVIARCATHAAAPRL